MKRKRICSLFYIACCICVFCSCTAYHTGTISMSMPIPTAYSRITNIGIGTARANYFLGLGGFDKQGLLIEAKRNLYRDYPLLSNQIYANATVDSKRSFYLFYWVHKVTISADIVDYDSTRLNHTSSQSTLLYNSPKVLLPDQLSMIKIGDTVAVFKRAAENNMVIGTVLSTSLNTVTIGIFDGKTYTTANALLENTVPLKPYAGCDTYSRHKLGQQVEFKNKSEPLSDMSYSGVVKNVVGDLYLIEYTKNGKKIMSLHKGKKLVAVPTN